jgi:hypothetical protein
MYVVRVVCVRVRVCWWAAFQSGATYVMFWQRDEAAGIYRMKGSYELAKNKYAPPPLERRAWPQQSRRHRHPNVGLGHSRGVPPLSAACECHAGLTWQAHPVGHVVVLYRVGKGDAFDPGRGAGGRMWPVELEHHR